MDEGDEQDMTAAGNGNVGDDASPPSLRYPDPFIEYLLYIGGASLRCSRAATSCVWALLVVVTPILVLWLFLRKAYANEVDKAYAEESIAIGASLWLARLYDFYVAVGYPRKVNAREEQMRERESASAHQLPCMTSLKRSTLKRFWTGGTARKRDTVAKSLDGVWSGIRRHCCTCCRACCWGAVSERSGSDPESSVSNAVLQCCRLFIIFGGLAYIAFALWPIWASCLHRSVKAENDLFNDGT